MRNQATNPTRLFLVVCLTSALAACSSGSSENSSTSPPTATSAEGLWNGTTSTNRTVGGLVLNDGSYWVFYTAIGNPNVLAGLVQGTGTSNLGSFTSSDTRDFNLEGAGILAATISGSYVQKNTFNGTIAYLNGATGNFTTTYDSDYELAPDINLVAGNYFGVRADNQTVGVTLDAAGAVSGSSSDGCTFAGSFSPRGTGNVFNVTVTFAGGSCSNGTNTVTGVAFYDAATRRLFSAGLNGTRTNGFMFIGTKL